MVKFLLLFVYHSIVFYYSHRVLLYITYIVHVVFVFISQYVVVFVVIFFFYPFEFTHPSDNTILFLLLRRVFTLIFAFSRFFCLCYLLQAAPEWLKNYLKSFSDSYKSTAGMLLTLVFLDSNTYIKS